MDYRKGFTLTELMIVVVVVGILAALAVPFFAKTAEKAKGNEAKIALNVIRTGQKMYRLDVGTYTNDLDGSIFGKYIERPPRGNWAYSATSGASNFNASATRSSGSQSGKNITIDQDGNISGDYPYR